MYGNAINDRSKDSRLRAYVREEEYGPEKLKKVASKFFSYIASAPNVNSARERLHRFVSDHHFDTFSGEKEFVRDTIIRVRDCARALLFMLKERSEMLSNFSVAQALYDIARDEPRPDLKPAFYAEMIHLFLGIQGEGPQLSYDLLPPKPYLEGRDAAVQRSIILDRLWENRADKFMRRYPHGLMDTVRSIRVENKKRILKALGGGEDDWNDWRWHFKNIIRDHEQLAALIPLTNEQMQAIDLAKRVRLPFGITPYYVSLMDNDLQGADLAVRAQVIPSLHYVQAMTKGKQEDYCSFDFMLEKDTSPVDLVTRRYPAIVILKPYNTCPQICVYCQRNWEIDDVLSSGAMATRQQILEALEWIRERPAIHEVLITGGDPLSLNNKMLGWILEKTCENPNLERIRIGTRTLVTMPMRFTEECVNMLASFRLPMKREISLVTHVEHPYEVTPEMFNAIEKLRGQRINVYNQNVYTFYVSRRFEAALLRRLLKRVGIEPYYTFNTKGKDETTDFRVPIARLLQEQKEEARLLPGLSRVDEAVFNVPGLGKNYLRALQHRDVLAVMPDGSRVYEFHPWEKNIRGQKTYVGSDVPLLEYLKRLESRGERISDYETIWYYY
ncbi:MAG: KamA family radical SAM protein [candidate division Zixibacteria bacterium]|nr:KamA family radical SAM protein [candidate division Zixibacteria bacterium]